MRSTRIKFSSCVRLHKLRTDKSEHQLFSLQNALFSSCLCHKRYFSYSTEHPNVNFIALSKKNAQVKNCASLRLIHITPLCRSCTDDSDVLAEMLSSNCDWNNLQECGNVNKALPKEHESSNEESHTNLNRNAALSKNVEETNRLEEKGNDQREETGKRQEPQNKEYSDYHTNTQIAPSSSRQLVLVKLHNLPRNWLYEEIIEFVDQVAEHAGIEPPVFELLHHSVERGNNNDVDDDDAEKEINSQIKSMSSGFEVNQADTENEGSALPQTRSPFIQHIYLPFGRRTGVVYGHPLLLLTSLTLANYLVNDLNFSEDDYRQRIYFTKETNEKINNDARPHSRFSGSSTAQTGRTSFVPIEETLEAEKAEALRTLELDRYLLSPDLLWEIPRKHQKKLLTRNERILIDSFLSSNTNSEESVNMERIRNAEDHESDMTGPGKTTDNNNDDDDNGIKSSYSATFIKSTEGVADDLHENEHVTEMANSKKGKASKKKRSLMLRRKRKTSRLAGEQTDIGRGSFINMPISKPYVRHRIM